MPMIQQSFEPSEPSFAKEASPKKFVKDYSIRSVACCFSGGKDSLVATHYMMAELADLDIEKHVVFADTGVMLPIAEEFVRETCESFGWKLTVVQGHFFEKAIKIGMPRMKHRWCCFVCKVDPMQQFIKTLPSQRAEVTGLRRSESFRRAKLNQVYYKRKVPSWAYAPIIAWSEKQVFRYIRNNNLPMPPHYRLGLHETCMCGVYSNRKQMEILKAQFPELWKKILTLEANFRKKGAAFYFNNKPVYAKDIDKQKVLEA
jgi:3'-phosphoadenosine 5'-phosphosulfate sulfotransferase (PAPS reductase)/FAD synthetase